MLTTLVLGYGNPDREDDGVAWHILQQLAAHYGCPITTVDEIELDSSPLPRSPTPSPPHLAFALQLTPEMADPLARYQRVCFVDAHTGAYPEAVRMVSVEPGYQPSAFTHHLTPESCLAIAQSLYGQSPVALVVSIRGYSFGYKTSLSDPTHSLAQSALLQIIAWLDQ